MTSPAGRFIEQLGVLLGAEGYPRVAGQLLGVLLLSPEPRSLDDLATRLHVSKASVSINIRMLQDKGVVERVAHPGDRRDYYAVTDDLLARSIEQRITKWRRFHEAIHDARAGAASKQKAVRARLHDLDAAYGHMITAMADALGEWRRTRAAKVARAS